MTPTNVALWIAQGLLAAVFLLAGVLKLTRPHDQLSEQLGWPGDYSTGLVRFVGLVEVLGALGLILPGVTAIATVLVPWAAVGLAVEQAGAITVHVRRKEPQAIIANIVLVAVAAFVARGRFGEYPL